MKSLKRFLIPALLCLPLAAQLQKTTARPALLPAPIQVQWKEGYFKMSSSISIGFQHDSLKGLALQLKIALQQKGLPALNILQSSGKPKYTGIQLSIEPGLSENKEAYRLKVQPGYIRLEGGTREGIYRGIQSLLQLVQDGNLVPACEIEDQPAFSWRAFMVDVGRNYQSLEQLKQQIEVMAAYKLNLFHFHLTEDLAWRWQIKAFPALTDATHMERWKGKYYTRDEILELERFCRERFITMVPEIDIPGHSKAFTRAMGTDMQTDSGVAILKIILKEIAEQYPFRWLHIGGDEVKVRNKNYLKESASYVHGLGLSTLAWDPGAELDVSTVRQLWMREGVKENGSRYVDSRHLYLNHMDPLESVTTIYQRKLGNREKGDSSLLGATLCIWNDRNVKDEKDLLLMNPIYPGMLAFAERVWRGGGTSGWITNITLPNDSFQLFEKRLMTHKTLYFQNKAFPYASSSLQWKLIGPFHNGGQLSKVFAPEIQSPESMPSTQTIRGGTLVLRHWWDPAVKGFLDSPQENTTWYASARFYSNRADTVAAWIGFQNISRSMAGAPPPEGAWDLRGSQLWLNEHKIEPPQWNQPQGSVNLETPLTNEGYEYRLPTPVFVKKGWNQLLVKLPVGSFKSESWNNPVKWMFSFVFLREDFMAQNQSR